MDWVFTEILNIRKLKANKAIEGTKANKLVENPMLIKHKALIIKETERGILLSNFDTRNPDKGNPMMELIGITNKTVPNCASFR